MGFRQGQWLKGTDLNWVVYRLPALLDNMVNAAESDSLNLAWL